MNILICSIDYKPLDGGIAEFVFNISKAFVLLGHNIYMVAPYIEGADEFDQSNGYFPTFRVKETLALTSFSIKRIFFDFGSFIRTVRSILQIQKFVNKLVTEKNIDCIICLHWDVFGLVALLINIRKKVPYYLVAHGLEILRKGKTVGWLVRNLFQWLVQNIIFAGAAGVFANSSYTKALVCENIISKKNVIITFCGVDIKKFYRKDRNLFLFEKKCLLESKIILSLSRLVKRKGLDNSIRAFGELTSTHPNSQLLYLIGGKGPDEERLRSIVSELNLQNKVIFCGFIGEEQKCDFYNLADLFILPCREEESGDVEGLGMVYLEANACEKPVIAGNSGGVSDAVQDGVSGLLVAPCDIQDIVCKMERLTFDSSYSARLGIAGRKRVKENFTWEKVAQRFEFGLRAY